MGKKIEYWCDQCGSPTTKDFLSEYQLGQKSKNYVELCVRCQQRIIRLVVEEGVVANKNLRYCCTNCKGTGKVEVDDDERSDNFHNYPKTVECQECKLP